MTIIAAFKELYEKARDVVNPWKLSDFAESGGVGAAIESENGEIFLGVCIDTSSSMGFCAEHAAAAAMITARQNRVIRMVAVDWEGRIYPPCGRCRELISQLHPDNTEAMVLVNSEQAVSLSELLPYNWQSVKKK